MHALDAKIPPPLVALTLAATMWTLASYLPLMVLPLAGDGLFALMLAGLGVGVALAGVVSFHRAKTTVNPLQPDKASALVTSGIYRWTRNPMYLGMLLVLAGWALWLGQASAWLGLPLFVAYMNRFQIGPEERVLERLFGKSYQEWCAKVRRWC